MFFIFSCFSLIIIIGEGVITGVTLKLLGETNILETPWKPADEPVFNLFGSNMDEIYESIVRSADSSNAVASLSSLSLPKGEAVQPKPSLKDYIIQSKQNSKIQAQIEKLEKKLANEKQFNRQVEIRAEIRNLEKEI